MYSYISRSLMFQICATFSNKFVTLLMVIAFLFNSLYSISPTYLWRLTLSGRGTLVSSKDTSNTLNYELEGSDCVKGWCSEKFIWFLSRSIKKRSLVWYETEFDAMYCNISSLIFLFLSLIALPTSQMVSFLVAPPRKLKMATYEYSEVAGCSGSFKATSNLN